MRVSIVLKLNIFLLAFVSAIAAEAAPAPRAPTGKWIVDFADARCVAQRDYGTPDRPLKLVLKAPPVGDVMQVAVLKRAGEVSAQQAEAVVTVDRGRPLKTDLLMFTPNRSKERVFVLNMPSADFAAVRKAKTLSIRSGGLDESFALSQMEPLLKVVDECVADLRKVWNIGEGGAETSGLTSRAKADLARLFSDKDYPAAAIIGSQSGKVRFALLVGEDGRVADCTVVETSGVPVLDSQACALVKARAKFQPAIGLDGKPAKDSVFSAIVWRMPS